MAPEMEGPLQGQAAPESEPDILDLVELAPFIPGPEEEGHREAKRSIIRLLGELLGRPGVKLNKALITDLIADIDKIVSAQVDEVLHCPEVQKLESAWRSLFFLVDRTDFTQNIKIEFINCSKDDLLADFEDEPDITNTGMFKHVYNSGYGVHGGEPVGAVIANYEFTEKDVKLLRFCSKVAAMAHAPFVASAGAKMFGIDSYEKLPGVTDLELKFNDGPQYASWRGFRDSEDSRYVALTAPRFLLREPYAVDGSLRAKGFDYDETTLGSHEHFLWGNSAFAFAANMTRAFANYHWCFAIVGPQTGGQVENLPTHVFNSGGANVMKIPTEAVVTDALEKVLANLGFTSLAWRQGSDNATFFDANCVKKPAFYGTSDAGKEAERNDKLASNLPYILIVSRLAHYLKVLQREKLGGITDVAKLKRDLEDWIGDYVADMENPAPEVAERRPLKRVVIDVAEKKGEVGYYTVSLQVVPHMRYREAEFTLSLIGRLDKRVS